MIKYLISLVLILSLAGLTHAKTMTYSVLTSSNDGRCVVGDSCAGYATETSFRINDSIGSGMGFVAWSSHIPKNATVTSAYWKPFAGASYDTTSSTITIDYVTNAIPAIAEAATVSGSPVTWTVTSAWTAHEQQQSPDIASLITAYIAGASYDYGEYFILRTVGSGLLRLSDAWDYSSNNAAQLVVNYTGGDGIIDAWMARPESRTKQYVYAQVWNHDAGDKIKFYLDNDLKSTYTVQSGDVPANAAIRFEKAYLYDYTGLSAGSHHIDIVLTTSDDSVRGTFTKTWTTLHSGIPLVGINEDNAICTKNGSACDLFFPLTTFMFATSTDAADWHDYKLYNGMNTIFLEGYCETRDMACVDAYMTGINAQGLKFVGGTRERAAFDYANPNNDADLMFTNSSNCSTPASFSDCSFVNRYKDNAGLLGWNWADEPDALPATGPPFWGASVPLSWTDQTKAVDTSHPVFTLLSGYSYPEGATLQETSWHYLTGSKMQVADVLGADYYPYVEQNTTWYGLTINLARWMSALDSMQAWNYNMVPLTWASDPQGQGPNSPLGGATACGQISGTANAAVTTTDTSMTDTRLSLTPNAYVGGLVQIYPQSLIITSNTATTFNGDAWTNGGGNPGDGKAWTGGIACVGWTGAQFANELWLMVIHGNKGIIHFGPNLFTTTPADVDTAATAFKTAVGLYKQAILSTVSSKMTAQTRSIVSSFVGVPITVNLPWSAASSVGSGGRVDYTVRDYGGKTYVIASRVYLTTESPGWPDDGNTTAVSATFTLTGLSGTKIATRLLTSGTVTVTDGVFSDNFTEYQNEIYEIGDTAGGSTTLGSGGTLSIGTGGTITFQ